MRIAIISDVHLGYGSGTDLFQDPFEAFGEALDKSMGCDLILLAGDLFDSRSPSTEILARAMELLIKPISSSNGTRLVMGIGKDVGGLTPLHQQGIPVVAIHGTHERRVKGLMNPVQALEKAGFLIHLHCNGIVLEKDGERVCVHGMSGVPEQFSGAVMDRWGPRPVKGCFNILMIHQSVSPFMYANHLLPVERLPKGFGLYVLGHIHEGKKAEHSGSPLIIPGSLVTTQLTKEAMSPRGMWVMDTKTSDAAFIPIESQRRFYHIEHEGTQEELESGLEKLLAHDHPKKPLIRVKGAGLDLPALKSRFSERSVLSVRQPPGKEETEAVSFQEHSLSVKELGSQLLKKNLKAADLDNERFAGLFDLLVEGKPDQALRLLRPERN